VAEATSRKPDKEKTDAGRRLPRTSLLCIS